MVVFSICVCITCPAIAGGDHSDGALNGDVLFLLDGVAVVTVTIVVAVVAVLDGIVVRELWWCLSQYALCKSLSLFVGEWFWFTLARFALIWFGFCAFLWMEECSVGVAISTPFCIHVVRDLSWIF